MYKVHISKENMKLGKICSVSTAPIKGCVPGVPCVRECYAMKAYRLRPVVRKAWDENMEFARVDMGGFFDQIGGFLDRNNKKFFRWFVGGDIPNQEFLDLMNVLASDFSQTRFLAFTKNHGLDFSNLNPNLVIIASMWPNWGNSNIPLRKAWMQDGSENRVPGNALECTGACDQCNMCWHLPDLNRDVVFHKH